MALRTFTHQGETLRFGNWHGYNDQCYIALHPLTPKPSKAVIQHLVVQLQRHGYRTIHTAALGAPELHNFEAVGFNRRERLVVFAHSLSEPIRPTMPTRAVHRFQYRHCLEIDHRCFADAWRLDLLGLRDALQATTRVRFRMIDARGGGAYAITGASQHVGYLQRLAVDPSIQGSGIGTALVLDGLAWLQRRKCHTALVNTQETNERAQALYHRCGFVQRLDDLHVMELVLESQ